MWYAYVKLTNVCIRMFAFTYGMYIVYIQGTNVYKYPL